MSLLLLSFISVHLPQSNIVRSLVFKLEAYNNWYPQQKVYLHLDKERYFVDEKVWFKAYLVDAVTHRPDNSSTNLYVELVDPQGIIVQIKLVRMEGGYGHGDFSFQETVLDGYYRIRAYTNYMQNFSSDFYFIKDIYISNPYFKTYATRTEVKAIKKSFREKARKETRFDVSFLPEGGYLLSNVSNRVAFKAINDLGDGINVKGTVKDKKGRIVADLSSSHRGMGVFDLAPEPGNKYTAIISTEDGKQASFPLPNQIDMGINLKAERQTNNLKVSLVTNITTGSLPPNTVYYLVAHSRGKSVYTAELDLKDTTSYTLFIPLKNLPSGVIHLTLFNYKPAPVSERLVYVNNNDHLRISITPDRSSAGKRNKINLGVNVRDASGSPVRSELSLSIAETIDANTSGNLLSYLLLSSDLKGNIEDPDYYFTNMTPQKENHLDMLMLTQGWRRFDWNTVLLNQKVPLKYNKERGIEITGRITRDFFNIPLRDIPVTLTIMDQYNDVFTTRSDIRGRYSFGNLYYEDTVSVRIEAEKESGRKNLVIIVDGKEQEPLDDMTYTTSQYLKKRGPQGRYVVEEEPEDDDPFKEQNTRIDRIHSEPRDVIIVDDKMSSYQNMGQLLQGRIPGVNVTGNKVIIRGISTFYGSTDPLFLVDGIPVDPGYALSMSPHEIQRIEVLKGPDAAIYGVRGANGVIAVYTKRGKFMIRGRLDFKMLGYSVPSEFYSPKYVSPDRDPFEDDRKTLLWMPALQTNAKGEAEVEFYTSDIPGRYIITAETISNNGEPGTGISFIEIK